ncbi:MAG: PAS domain S-box protein [Desulfotignum sp.]|nr:PAS domain S-box protein [Desulfotignum sp.]
MAEKPTYEELERRVQELKTDYTQLEKKLHEAELFSEEIMTYMSEGFVQTDIRGNILFINQRLSEMLGYLPEQIIGKCWLDIVPAEQQAIAQEAEARRLQGHTDRYEIILRRKDGHRFPVMIGAGPRFDKESNEFIGTMGVVSDITERKLTEEALRESEARFKALHNASFGGIAIHDQGVILECNQGLSEMTGYEYSELIGMNGLLLIAEKSRETVMNNIRTGYEKPYEAFGLRKNGEEFPIQLEARNVPYKGKQVRTVEFRDITERKRAEEELKRSEENYRLLVENQTDLVVKVDMDGRFLFVSPSYCRMFDKKETEILGKHFMPLVHEDDREPTAKAMEALFSPPHTAYIEQRAMTKEGWRWLAWADTAVLDKAGSVKEIIGVGRDITEPKRTEEALKSNYALLQIAGETALFGGWSVDLENNICTWSDAVADIHDVPRGYAPPVQEAINFYAPEWREKITQCFNACAKDGISYDEEMEIITQKGKRVWVRTTAKALKNTNGRIIKVQGSFQDITERKQAEKLLIKKEALFRGLFDHMTSGSAVYEVRNDGSKGTDYIIRDI